MPKLLKIHLWPLWLLALFTQAKSFRDNPIIGSAMLNRLGLHIARVLAARASARFRWFLLSPLMDKANRRKFHKDGFVIFEGFLSPDDVSALRAEIADYNGEVRQMVQGDTATQRILLDQRAGELLPRTAGHIADKRLRRYLAYAGAKASHSILYVQRIHHGFRTAKADPQKNMHSDTFHPTMKAWLFLEDVPKEKGPFTYVRGSSRLSWKRLKWEYKRSIQAAGMQDKYSEKGSLRAGPDDLAEMGLPAPEGISVKAGTLVIANTNGFHGRGQAEDNASRLELWAYSRHNPFSPWPGLPLDTVLQMKHAVMQWNWKRLDKKASMRNSKASWHKIDAATMVKQYKQTP
jgi:hypothetical protein